MPFWLFISNTHLDNKNIFRNNKNEILVELILYRINKKFALHDCLPIF